MNEATTIEKLAQARDKANAIAAAAKLAFDMACAAVSDDSIEGDFYARGLVYRNAEQAADEAWVARMAAGDAWRKATAEGETK